MSTTRVNTGDPAPDSDAADMMQPIQTCTTNAQSGLVRTRMITIGAHLLPRRPCDGKGGVVRARKARRR